MQIIDNNFIVMFDIDETLVMHGKVTENSFEIQHPLNKGIYILAPHTEHLRLMTSYKKQGYIIIVWTAQGHEWGNAIVSKLGINDMVDIVMSKPVKFVDDLNADGILGSRVYIPFKE